MTYGPIAAFLIECFPARSRYISLPFPYHLGNGIFGGLTAVLAADLSRDEQQYVGLVFPCRVALHDRGHRGAVPSRDLSRIRIWSEVRREAAPARVPARTRVREPTGPLPPPERRAPRSAGRRRPSAAGTSR